MEEVKRVEYYAKPCFFSAYFIDIFIVLMGFWLSFVAFVQYAWWSYPLSLLILLVTLGLGKSLFLNKVILDGKKLILDYVFFGRKIIDLDRVKEIRTLTAIWACWKFTLIEKQPFDLKSLWIIINESILGTESYIKLEEDIRKMTGGD